MPTAASMPDDSIYAQAVAQGLLPEPAAGMITRLPDAGAGAKAAGPVSGTPASGPPKLVNWRRSKHPILPGWPSDNGRTLIIMCPWCGLHRHSRHGADEDCGTSCPCQLHGGNHQTARECLCRPGAGDGHRAAHCPDSSRSPLRAAGYVIREVRS